MRFQQIVDRLSFELALKREQLEKLEQQLDEEKQFDEEENQ